MINKKTIDQTARELGASKAAVAQWKKKGRQVPFKWRILIANKLGVSPNEVEERSRI
jgi:DNA-binding transcriptional regulator YdaS (Cro superfamily)